MTNPKHTDTPRSGDLVERLLDFDDNWHEATCKEAADRIEALEAEVERLRGVLGFAMRTLEAEGFNDDGPTLTRIRAALGEKP